MLVRSHVAVMDSKANWTTSPSHLCQIFILYYMISTHSSLRICCSTKLSLEFPWLASSIRYGN